MAHTLSHAKQQLALALLVMRSIRKAFHGYRGRAESRLKRNRPSHPTPLFIRAYAQMLRRLHLKREVLRAVQVAWPPGEDISVKTLGEGVAAVLFEPVREQPEAVFSVLHRQGKDRFEFAKALAALVDEYADKTTTSPLVRQCEALESEFHRYLSGCASCTELVELLRGHSLMNLLRKSVFSFSGSPNKLPIASNHFIEGVVHSSPPEEASILLDAPVARALRAAIALEKKCVGIEIEMYPIVIEYLNRTAGIIPTTERTYFLWISGSSTDAIRAKHMSDIEILDHARLNGKNASNSRACQKVRLMMRRIKDHFTQELDPHRNSSPGTNARTPRSTGNHS